jgi:hypothetical protein
MHASLPACLSFFILTLPLFCSTVAKNALTGSLPPEWGALTSLSTLDASANYLSGALPKAWTGMAALKDLRLDSNNLGVSGSEIQTAGSEHLNGNAC